MSAALKAYRRQQGINQEEAGKRMGISGSYISRLESGSRDMTPALEKRLAQLIDEGGQLIVEQTEEDAGQVTLFRARHLAASSAALKSNIKDLEAEKHDLEKKYAALKKKFTNASDSYFVSSVRLEAASRSGNIKETMAQNVVQHDSYRTLLKISDVIPELIEIRIKGIEAQIRATKTTLKQQQKAKGMNTGLPFDNLNPLNPPDQKALGDGT
ncbi:MAG: XRE family transcriptional regulator [Chitinophagaceae bacterium]|nr:MAG: XRE family transcriptional regulator [Chitinophagaceae bacterium]